MKIIINIARLAAFEKEIIKVINNFDSILYKNDFFFNHIDRLDTRAQVILSLFITDKKISLAYPPS
jgi:hypothetical protein